MRKLLFLFFALVSFSTQIFAYSGITAIGDSLFDGGDQDTAVVSYFKLFGSGLTDPPYSDYRFTNGQTAVEYLATSLGLNSTSTFQNFAVGGATTADMLTFVTSYLGTLPAVDAEHLYVLNGGGNGVETFSAQDAAQNMVDMVALLHSKGATDFLVLGLPTLVDAPRFSSAAPGVVQFLEDYTKEYNDYLMAGVAGLGLSTTARLTYFDTKTVLEEGMAMAVSNGFTNLTDACYDGTTVCTNPDNYLFWDDLHITTKVHDYLGKRMFAAISPVPEPTHACLLFAGLMLVFARRSQRLAI